MLAKHLATNHDLVVIPKFETSQMIMKKNRKIGKEDLSLRKLRDGTSMEHSSGTLITLP
ncbi:MAG: hypothetical protein Q8P67_25395 [archaeon]|nr:hypothetical protein [archaeon]